MGFETPRLDRGNVISFVIIKQSLWDLKLLKWSCSSKSPIIIKQSMWAGFPKSTRPQFQIAYHNKAVPMGFETSSCDFSHD